MDIATQVKGVICSCENCKHKSLTHLIVPLVVSDLFCELYNEN